MFDGIEPNARMLRSMFDQAGDSMVGAASGAGDSRQGMEVSGASRAPKMLSCHQMSEKMEIRSNIHRTFFAPNVRHHGQEPSIFVRSAMTSSSEMRMKMGENPAERRDEIVE
jgi:hypothetical protein